MATVSCIITYTPASGAVGDIVTSLTFGTDGAETAFASLTTAQVRQAQRLLSDAAKLLMSPQSKPGDSLTTKSWTRRSAGDNYTNT